VSGLTHGAYYTFTVYATNALGSSNPSSPSATPVYIPTVPVAPVIYTLGINTFAGPGGVSLYWSPPTDGGGSQIVGYIVTIFRINGPSIIIDSHLNDGGLLRINTILPLNDTYFFSVHAINGVGNSPESAPSNSITI
jgi:hypothetical protein